jgi:ribosome biogenesis protein UTP30
VDLNKSDLRKELNQAKTSTYMFINRGACRYVNLRMISGRLTCSAIKVGKTSMSANAVAENVLQACNGVASKIPKGWNNIQSMHIKTHDSVALPIFNQLLEEQDDVAFADEETKKRKRADEDKEKRKKKKLLEISYSSDSE